MSNLEQIKILREETGISIAQCRAALEKCGGNLEQAAALLRQEGAKIAEKKAGRTLKAGAIGCYLHNNGLLAALVELFCETDFVAKNAEFKALADDLAMQAAALAPQDANDLLAAPFIKDETRKVSEVVESAIQKFGEKIEVGRLMRLELTIS